MDETVSAICKSISAVACFAAATILFHFKRRSKVLFRLEIGLCIAFGLTHLISVALLFNPFSIPAHDHLPPLHDHIPYYVGFALRITTLGASIHYLMAIYINFLLKSKGWTEERMLTIETRMHVLVWLLGALYILYIFFHSDAGFAVLLSVLCCEASFILICAVAVIIKQKSEFEKNSEVFSQLVTVRSKENLNSFIRGLLVLTLITILVFIQALMFLPRVDIFIDNATKSNFITDIFPIDGLVVALLLTTTPGLIALYKEKYKRWASNYEPIPPTPYMPPEETKQKAKPVPKLSLEHKSLSVSS